MLRTTGCIFSGFFVLVFMLPGAAFAAGMRLGDAQFAKQLCDSWNESKLPVILGRKGSGGNGWIDTVTSRNVPVQQPAGYQKIVSGRADCEPAWPRFELVIEKQSDGRALCTSAGLYDGEKVTWQFLPDTAGWFSYARSFGYGAFITLWSNGMIGDFFTAKSNQDNFQIFFQLAGKLALKSDYKSGCSDMDLEDVEDARNDLLVQ